MTPEEERIISEIKNHISSRGGTYSEWYVGIAEEPRQRLFGEHNVKEKEDKWIFRQTSSNETARNIEKYFVNSLKTDGGTGGGDEKTKSVYAYKKASHTKP